MADGSSHFHGPAAGASTATAPALEELFKRIAAVDQQLQYIERREQEGWRVASEQIGSITENSRNATTAVANLELKLARDVQFYEEQLSKDIQVETQHRQEAEARLKQQITEESSGVRSAIATAEQNRFAELDLKVNDLTTNLAQLCNVVEERLTQLTDQLSNTLHTTRDEAQRVEDMMLKQKEEREKAEINLLAVLEETCVSLHQQIVAERNERIDSQKRMEKLLLEMSGRQWVRA